MVCLARVNTLPPVMGTPVQLEVSSCLVLALFGQQILTEHLIRDRAKVIPGT